jgi:hypothetical protein
MWRILLFNKHEDIIELLYNYNKKKMDFRSSIIVLLIVLFVLIVHGIYDYIQSENNTAFVKMLSELTSADIDSIDVYKIEHRQSNEYNVFIETIKNNIDKTNFISSSSDLSFWVPNHPMDNGKLFLHIKLVSGFEYSFEIRQPESDEAIYHIYCKSNKNDNLRLESKKLFLWANKYF